MRSASWSRTCSSEAAFRSTAWTASSLSSVVPPLTRTMEEMAERFFGRTPLTVDPGVNTGMPVLYSPASDVGADRVVNAVAAYEAYGRAGHTPVIVVDFGTATTFDAISATGEYIGGVICPGIGISADALFQRAARLPRVDVRKPPAVIGRTTVTSMQSGLFFGYVAMVDGIVARMRVELERGESAACIATGGMASIIAGESAAIQKVDPDLTLQGLRLIWAAQCRREELQSWTRPITAARSKPTCAGRTKATWSGSWGPRSSRCAAGPRAACR